MGPQASLFPPPQPPDGLPAGPRIASSARSHKLFFALRPAPEDAVRIAARVAAENRRLAIGGKPQEAQRLHVTLFVLCDYPTGAFPAARVARWMQAAASVRRPPFEVEFDRLARFGRGQRALALRCGDGCGVAGVRGFWHALGAALAEFDEPFDTPPFEPHMTVSYGGANLGERPVEPLRWSAREFMLIDSHSGAHVHEVLARWPLRAASACAAG